MRIFAVQSKREETLMETVGIDEMERLTGINPTGESTIRYAKGKTLHIWDSAETYAEGRGWVKCPVLVFRGSVTDASFPMFATDGLMTRGTVIRSMDELVSLAGRWAEGDTSMLSSPVVKLTGSYGKRVDVRYVRDTLYDKVERDARVLDVDIDHERHEYTMYLIDAEI